MRHEISSGSIVDIVDDTVFVISRAAGVVSDDGALCAVVVVCNQSDNVELGPSSESSTSKLLRRSSLA